MLNWCSRETFAIDDRRNEIFLMEAKCLGRSERTRGKGSRSKRSKVFDKQQLCGREARKAVDCKARDKREPGYSVECGQSYRNTANTWRGGERRGASRGEREKLRCNGTTSERDGLERVACNV